MKTVSRDTPWKISGETKKIPFDSLRNILGETPAEIRGDILEESLRKFVKGNTGETLEEIPRGTLAENSKKKTY